MKFDTVNEVVTIQRGLRLGENNDKVCESVCYSVVRETKDKLWNVDGRYLIRYSIKKLLQNKQL